MTTAPVDRRRTPGPVSPAPHVLREYALVADGERGALIGPRGEVAWLCVPRWDSPSVFSSLIGGRGCYTITPDARFVWGGYYEEGSLIWHSRWVTEGGILECREALAYPAEPERAVLLRQVHAVDTDAALDVSLMPRADYDRVPMTELHRRRGVWTARVGDLYLRWTGGAQARVRAGERLDLRLELSAGQEHELCLELSPRPLPDQLPDVTALWHRSTIAWQDAVPAMDSGLAPRDTRHHYAVLRGLTSRSGGMVAAATTGLPERSDAGRNYDYRYVWIRDLSFAGVAVAAQGESEFLDDAVRFVTARLLQDGDRLAPAYTTSGERVPPPRQLGVPGYPGAHGVAGNRINEQFQLDCFGEALELLAAAAAQDRLDNDGRRAVEVAADAIVGRWTEPDSGIWELDPQPWTHSRLAAVAGLRAASTAASDSAVRADWLALADKILADTAAHALHHSGRWQRSPTDEGLDAALLLPGLRGAVEAGDPRTAETLRAYLRELTVDGYAYRFRQDDRPLAQAEGSFLLCGFLVALSLQRLDDRVEARAWYERTRAACGPPQLFSEEFDTDQHQLRGNLPQAFVHALAIEASARLSC